jgi:uncharacterized protein YggU (UPF0235/DUF167 family)
VAFLASVLDVPAGAIRVVAGQRGRTKVVEIETLDTKQVHDRLARKVRSS